MMMGGYGILVIILVVVAVWMIANATKKTGPRETAGSAQDILDARLARGELTVEEYKKLRDTLGKGSAIG